MSALLLAGASLQAQVQPHATWRTIRSEHFNVHFTPELEELARRAAVHAESAYVELSKHLTKPRGRIDLLISDNVDFANGWATPFPSNRIGIYANPPVFESALRFTDDPTDLVITHELTHIFHLDRVEGLWKVLQQLLGRVPYFFPNAYQPRWLVEGLAVHYESKLTGSGRIIASDHHMIARASALEHQFPRLDQLSLARPHFPYGSSAYVYGSLFMDHLARKHGDRAMRSFVESSSRHLIPWWLNFPARRTFGRSLTSEYKLFADSLLKSAPTMPAAPPMPGWRDLTVDGAYAAFPRWLNDTALIYTGTPGRESYGAYRLQLRTPDAQGRTLDVGRVRVGRRNSRSPNAVAPDGSIVFSQHEFTSTYTLRSDLYVTRLRGGTTRLTKGARLAFPDVRADGLIAAIQTVPAGTRLALVSRDGKVITPITSGGLDEQWTEPRWSPDGRHIAAIRWTRGGTSEVVVIDTTGAIAQTLVRERTVNATPSWSPDGRYVYFSSDRTGIMNLYRAAFHRAAGDTVVVLGVIERVSDTRTGLFEPQPSPNGRELAAVVFKADGYHIGIAPLDSVRAESAPALQTVTPREPSPTTLHPAPSTSYSPWRSLVPTYWLPFFESALDSNAVRYGALVSGSDIVGRHSYQALLFVPTDNSGLTGSVFYRNARLGQPVIDLYATQDWENRGCILDSSQQNLCIGTLRRRIRDATLAFMLQRPRVRTSSYLSLGTGIEVRDYATDSTPLIQRIDSLYRRTYYYPRGILSAGWSNTQHPPLAISPEDGISLAGTARARWRLHDTAAYTVSVVGSTSAYKSLDLPGFGHHVLALNAAGGAQDNRGTGYFEVGGVSGGSVGVLPGYVLGEGRRTFGVRGFPAASQLGIRAYKASAEYRAPFVLPGRGLGALPLFLERTSITLFGDVGAAWCPGTYATRPAPSTSLCTTSDAAGQFVFLEPNPIGSVGGELNVLAAILSWDAPFRYRVGFAVPVLGMEFAPGAQKPTWYFTVGASF